MPKKSRKAQVLRYVGQGDYLPGVPRRDLSPDEFAALPEAVQQLCIDLGLYVADEAAQPEE